MEVNKILLVDDEADIREVAALILRRIGKFEIVLAASGEEGISMARSEKPDIILLDMMMPDMDGLATLKRLREDTETQHVPVIFLTAKALESDKAEYIARGACGVITKPFDPVKISRQVRDIAKVL